MERHQTALEQLKPHELLWKRRPSTPRVGVFLIPVGRFERDCRMIAREVAEWRKQEAWKGIAATWDEFCLAYVGLPEQVVHCLCQAASHLDQ